MTSMHSTMHTMHSTLARRVTSAHFSPLFHVLVKSFTRRMSSVRFPSTPALDDEQA